jgi:hypothetical protein
MCSHQPPWPPGLITATAMPPALSLITRAGMESAVQRSDRVRRHGRDPARRAGDPATVPHPRPAARRGVKHENCRRNIVHPMFVRLFIETDTDDLPTEEQDRKRRARGQARRSARVMRIVANPDRPRRP